MKNTLIKKYLVFVTFLIIIGIISGILYYYNLDSNIKENVLITLNNYSGIHINNILKHLIILIIILFLSIFVVGTPLMLFYVYFEGISIGFTITIFSVKYGLNGFLYGLFYTIFSKLFIILILYVLVYKIMSISRIIIKSIFNNRFEKDSLILKIKSSFVFIIIILVIDIIIYFTSPYFLNLISYFLVK